MKMAKKLLAVVMVLSMVAAFTAIAFAANPAVSFSVGSYADGKATVSARFVDCVGLKSGSLKFAYDAGSVTKIAKKNGADVKAIGDVDNAFAHEFNASANPAESGFYFKEVLWDSATWAAAENADEAVNGENFEFATFEFTATEGTVITVTGELKIGENTVAVNDSFTIGKASEKPPVVETTTAAPAPVETTTAAPAPVETTTAAPAPGETTTAKTNPCETTAPDTTPSQNTIMPSHDNEYYDAYGKKILAYDGLNGKAIIGYDKSGNPIYSEDKNARRSVILDNGGSANAATGTATGTKTADATGTKTASASVKTDGGKKTGDNGVLAIIAGVVALAGAAFVVTKKRK